MVTYAFDCIGTDIPTKFVDSLRTLNLNRFFLLANNINYPPYKPNAVGNELADKTICGDHQHYWGSHYDTHNMFGYSESGATLEGKQTPPYIE